MVRHNNQSALFLNIRIWKINSFPSFEFWIFPDLWYLIKEWIMDILERALILQKFYYGSGRAFTSITDIFWKFRLVIQFKKSFFIKLCLLHLQ